MKIAAAAASPVSKKIIRNDAGTRPVPDQLSPAYKLFT
jgi:hypothetical protein